jgi:hypothetical protein
MTSEEIIHLARSVGIHRFKVKYLARFVDAIAAAEREAIANEIQSEINDEIEDEAYCILVELLARVRARGQK